MFTLTPRTEVVTSSFYPERVRMLVNIFDRTNLVARRKASSSWKRSV